jgi:hypothetical protein
MPLSNSGAAQQRTERHYKCRSAVVLLNKEQSGIANAAQQWCLSAMNNDRLTK